MKGPRSLQSRLSLFIGLGVAILWIVTAGLTAKVVNRRIDKVFDSSMQEAAQRLLPLAVVDIIGREDEGLIQRIAPLRRHDELLTYVVRDNRGRVMMTSHNADPKDFPPFRGTGFLQTATHRLYYDTAVRGSLTIGVAEPLSYRADAERKVWLQLAVPLLILIPLSFFGIWFLVRTTLLPVAAFGAIIATRGAGDLSPVPAADVPDEVAPVAVAVNGLIGRLRRTLAAERSFTANAAHELRTPLAAALAQVQRLALETQDTQVTRRAAEIETSLKRLVRLSEKLMQLARAEGGRLRREESADIRPILQMVANEFRRDTENAMLALTVPEAPVMSDIDPDAFAILARNLIENAMRHGAPDAPAEVILTADGLFRVRNAGLIVPEATLATLTAPFERAGAQAQGSGLGLSIAKAVALGIGSDLTLRSPPQGRSDGFEAMIQLVRS